MKGHRNMASHTRLPVFCCILPVGKHCHKHTNHCSAMKKRRMRCKLHYIYRSCTRISLGLASMPELHCPSSIQANDFLLPQPCKPCCANHHHIRKGHHRNLWKTKGRRHMAFHTRLSVFCCIPPFGTHCHKHT